MKTKITYPVCRVLVPVLLLFWGYSNAQAPIQVDITMTPQDMVNALADNGCAAISNSTATGASGNQRSYGYFTADSGFPFSSGLVLSTGFAKSAEGPNTVDLSDTVNGWGGDNDLESSLGTSGTLNATVLEFDFVPSTNHISFDYIFASEEYTSWQDPGMCNFSDGFAFLLREAGSTGNYQNLAVIPGTTTPVQVTTVRGPGFCPSANVQYFDAFNGTDHPTNFNGQTVMLTAQATVTPGTLYHIKLVIADQGDDAFDSAVFLRANSFSSGKDLGPDRLLADGTAICDGQQFPIDGTIAGAQGYRWYKDGNLIQGATAATYNVNATGDYRVEVQLSSTCFANGEIRVEYAPAIPSAPITYYQCDDNGDGLTAYYLNRMQTELESNLPGLEVVSFFRTMGDAQGNTNPLTISQDQPFYNSTANQQVFSRMRNDAGCTGIVPIVLSTPSAFITILPVFDVCDDDGTDDGFKSISLNDLYTANPAPGAPLATVSFFRSATDAIAYSNPIPAQFTNTVAGGQSVYVNLSTAEGCFAIIEMPVAIHYFGDALETEEVMLCDGSDVTLDGGNYASWAWDTSPPQTTRTLTVTEPGTYNVTLTTNLGCEATKTFTVGLSGRATGATFSLKEFTGSNNMLTIHPEGEGIYEYSLDGITYQEEPVFTGLAPGEYMVFIRDTQGCGPVYMDTVVILDYPLYFTPNGDGVNDTWRIPFGYYRPGIWVTVFDRYGKVITGFRGSDNGWDGTHNGSPLPATDYWFVVELEDGKAIRGHFSMIR